ncbi:MAG TPA: alanine racemase [Kiritimatiellia bacterium]|nr:alanine racemase [Kiritimatiellia bacterium]
MNRMWVEIDLRQLEHNIRQVQAALGPETKLVFVIKANAYGHGLREVARHAFQCGINWFAVAYLQEALIVREVAPDASIIILGATAPDEVKQLAENSIIPILVDESHAALLSDAANNLGCKIDAHLKIDTGMGRFGVPWINAVHAFREIDRLPGLRLTGICTHFASVEIARPSLGPDQVERFQSIADEISKFCDRPLMRHVSSSRAFQCFPQWDFDAVRPGIILYGYGARDAGLRVVTQPVLQWKTRVMMVKKVPANTPVGYYSSYATPKETCIATIAAGYADGYHRLLGNRGFALIHGRRYPVVGRVSMNWITLDIGPDSPAQPGDEVVLIGSQGNEHFWADEMARMARTIAYEMLTSIDSTVERIYVT